MAHLLDGYTAKIDRANENIKNLEAEIQALNSPDKNPYRIVRKLDHEKRAYTFTVFGPPLSPRFAVLAGEIIHHLRSSLDHLVWALVLARHPSPNLKTGFPICDTRQKFVSAMKGGQIEGISVKARTIIDSVQPYREPKPHINALWVLHTLANTEKHKLLPIVTNPVVLGNTIAIDAGKPEDGTLAEVIGMSPPPELLGLRPAEDGTEVFAVHFGKHGPDAQVEADFSVQISFEKLGDYKFPAVIGALVFLRNSVTKVSGLLENEI